MTASARLRFSAGTGPAECALAVAHAVRRCGEDATERGVTTSTMEAHPGPVDGGYTQCTVELSGPDDAVEALVRRWEGTVQWVCPSPLRPHHRRKNWFIDVRAVEAVGSVQHDPPAATDLEVTAVRAGGPGGQHRNKAATGIRLTHLPTGITVEATEARSQAENRRKALERLRRRLAELSSEHQMVERHAGWTTHRDLRRGDAGLRFDGPDFVERHP